MEKEGYEIGNVDISITLEQPKLRPFIQEMRFNIGNLLRADIKNVSVKAGTNEKMRPVPLSMAWL